MYMTLQSRSLKMEGLHVYQWNGAHFHLVDPVDGIYTMDYYDPTTPEYPYEIYVAFKLDEIPSTATKIKARFSLNGTAGNVTSNLITLASATADRDQVHFSSEPEDGGDLQTRDNYFSSLFSGVEAAQFTSVTEPVEFTFDEIPAELEKMVLLFRLDYQAETSAPYTLAGTDLNTVDLFDFEQGKFQDDMTYTRKYTHDFANILFDYSIE